MNTGFLSYSLVPPPRPTAVTSRLRSFQTFPKLHTRTQRYCSFIQYGLNHRVIFPFSVLILVLPVVSFITLMFYVSLGYVVSLTQLCFIVFYHCIYVLMYYVLICSASQLQECLTNLLTYLLTCVCRKWIGVAWWRRLNRSVRPSKR